LLAELAESQHSGPVEKAFKEYLLAEAEKNFDEAVARKGAHIMPDLFLSRGVYFLDKGDLQSAKKEFLAGIDEASGLPYSEGQQEAVIACHYNLAVAEQGLGHSKEALAWIRLAEEEQEKLGRTVLPEITPARQKLESIATSFP
jgi:tetratricopeptide (TPR) repeat protein